jgi:hypothetical protein
MTVPYPWVIKATRRCMKKRPSSSCYSRNFRTSHVSPLMTDKIFVKELDCFGDEIDYVLRLISINDENSKSFQSRQTSITDAML